jgi:hypothetical protein
MMDAATTQTPAHPFAGGKGMTAQKTVIVTGGNHGIGFECARAL